MNTNIPELADSYRTLQVIYNTLQNLKTQFNDISANAASIANGVHVTPNPSSFLADRKNREKEIYLTRLSQAMLQAKEHINSALTLVESI